MRVDGARGDTRLVSLPSLVAVSQPTPRGCQLMRSPSERPWQDISVVSTAPMPSYPGITWLSVPMSWLAWSCAHSLNRICRYWSGKVCAAITRDDAARQHVRVARPRIDAALSDPQRQPHWRYSIPSIKYRCAATSASPMDAICEDTSAVSKLARYC